MSHPDPTQSDVVWLDFSIDIERTELDRSIRLTRVRTRGESLEELYMNAKIYGMTEEVVVPGHGVVPVGSPMERHFGGIDDFGTFNARRLERLIEDEITDRAVRAQEGS